MASKNVTGHVVGGQPKLFDDCETVGCIKKRLAVETGYVASVNGDPADDDYELSDYDHVSLAPAVKGGC